MKIREYYGMRKVVGDVGVEIEMEGTDLPTHRMDLWHITTDGSLRGEAYEYVLRAPLPLDSLHKAFTELRGALSDRKSKVDEKSDRTSTHVHINCQELNRKEVTNFIILYIILEEVLLNFCGESRMSNLFCLPAKDAEFLIDQLELVSRTGNMALFRNDELRYASINVAALSKYGSLEFRGMRGTGDFDAIKLWVELLLQLRAKASEYDRPQDIIDSYSYGGEDAFVRGILGNMYDKFMSEDLKGKVYQGVRLVQDVAYAFRRRKTLPGAAPAKKR
jgi:hypothetical protein